MQTTQNPNPIREYHHPIPPGFLEKWYALYFVDTLIFHALLKTPLCSDVRKMMEGTIPLDPALIRNGLTRRLKDRLEAQLFTIAETAGPGKDVPIPRVADLSVEDFYHHYLFPNQPVVLEGAAKDWQCVKEWSPEFFKKRYGDQTIPVVEGKNWEINGEMKHIYDSLELDENYTVSKLVEDVQRGGSKYATFYPFLHYHPELSEHIDFRFLKLFFKLNRRFPWQKRIFPKLYLGSPGTSTPNHNEGTINLHLQVYGEKEWELRPPDSTPFLYPEYIILGHCGSHVDFRNPNHQKFPLFKYSDRYQCVLKPGDILFLPAWWWHGTYNRTVSISVSNFALRMRNAFKAKSMNFLALMDPWNIGVFGLGFNTIGRIWEAHHHQTYYNGRNIYHKRWVDFFHLLGSELKKRLYNFFHSTHQKKG